MTTSFVQSRAAEYWVDVSTGSDSNPGTEALPFQSLGAAFSQLGTSTDNATVYVAAGRYTGPLNAKLNVSTSKAVCLIGSSSDDEHVDIDLGGVSWFCAVSKDAELSMHNVRLSGGFSGENDVGSFITAGKDASVSLSFVDFQGGWQGPFIVAIDSSSVLLANCTLLDSQSDESLGGFVCCEVCDNLLLQGCLFEGGRAARGGAVYVVKSSRVVIEASVFRNNSVGGPPGDTAAGGGLFAESVTTLTITDSVFDSNKATAVERQRGDVLDVAGAGVALSAVPSPVFTRTLFINNQAVASSTALPSGVTVCTAVGAGLYIEVVQTVLLTACDFTENLAACLPDFEGSGQEVVSSSAAYGGAAAIFEPSRVTIADCTFTSNGALAYGAHNTTVVGGAYFAQSGETSQFNGCVFEGNEVRSGAPDQSTVSAVAAGAAIAFPEGNNHITSCLLVGMRSRVYGSRFAWLTGGVVFGSIEMAVSMTSSVLRANNDLQVSVVDPDNSGEDLVDGLLVYAVNVQLSGLQLTNHSFVFDADVVAPVRGLFMTSTLVCQTSNFTGLRMSAAIAAGVFFLPRVTGKRQPLSSIQTSVFRDFHFVNGSYVSGVVLATTGTNIDLTRVTMEDILLDMHDIPTRHRSTLFSEEMNSLFGGLFTATATILFVDQLVVRNVSLHVVSQASTNPTDTQLPMVGVWGWISCIACSVTVDTLSIANTSMSIVGQKDTRVFASIIGQFFNATTALQLNNVNISANVIEFSGGTGLQGAAVKLNGFLVLSSPTTVVQISNSVFEHNAARGLCSGLGGLLVTTSEATYLRGFGSSLSTSMLFESSVMRNNVIECHAHFVSCGFSLTDSLVVRDSIFERNVGVDVIGDRFAPASGDLTGGAVFVRFDKPNWTADFINTTFLENSADVGGAITLYFTQPGVMTVDGCTFTANTATYNTGGAINLAFEGLEQTFDTIKQHACLVNITRSVFTGNVAAAAAGGALYISGASLDVSSSVFRANVGGVGPFRTNRGGAIALVYAAYLNVNDTLFEDNLAPTAGGAMQIASTANFRITNCVFNRNIGSLAGAIYFVPSFCESETSYITNCSFADNFAEFGGGVLTVSTASSPANPTVLLQGCSFVRNSGIGLSGCLSPLSPAAWRYAACAAVGDSKEILAFDPEKEDYSAIGVYPASIRAENCIYEENLNWFMGWETTIDGIFVETPANITRTAGQVLDILAQSVGQCGPGFEDRSAIPNDPEGPAYAFFHVTPLNLTASTINPNTLLQNLPLRPANNATNYGWFQFVENMSTSAQFFTSGVWKLTGYSAMYDLKEVEELLKPYPTHSVAPTSYEITVAITPLAASPETSFVNALYGDALSLSVPCTSATGLVQVVLYDQYGNPPLAGTSVNVLLTPLPGLTKIVGPETLDTGVQGVDAFQSGRSLIVNYTAGANSGGNYTLSAFFNTSVLVSGTTYGGLPVRILQPSSKTSSVKCAGPFVAGVVVLCSITFRDSAGNELPFCNSSMACTSLTVKSDDAKTSVGRVNCDPTTPAVGNFAIQAQKPGKVTLTASWAGHSLSVSPSPIAFTNTGTWWNRHWMDILAASIVVVLLVVGLLAWALYRRYRRHVIAANTEYRLVTTTSFLVDDEGRLQLSLDEILRDPAITKIPFEELVCSEGESGLLGSGAAGSVFAGMWGDQPVAIKRLHVTEFRVDDDDADLEDLRREIKILSRLDHPHVLKLLGISVVLGSNDLALVTELMERGSLASLISRGTLAGAHVLEQLQLATDIASGCAYLHDSCSPPIIHRDLKPANVLINREGVAKVADFGISTFQSSKRKMTQNIGTPFYTAIEVLTTNDYTEKCDLFSYGMILVEIFTGKAVYSETEFASVHIGTMLNRIIHHNLRPAIPDHIPLIVRNIILECWSADPELRPKFSEILLRFHRLKITLARSSPIIITSSSSTEN